MALQGVDLEPALKGAVLRPAWNASNFIIYHRDENGKPDAKYHPNHAMATCVINSINICRDMLHTPEVRSAFKELATEYSILRPKAWFLQGPATEEQMARLSEDFIDKVLTTFPYVFVDDSMKNPVRMAVHWRNKWDSDFKFSDQYITLNGLVSENWASSHVMGA